MTTASVIASYKNGASTATPFTGVGMTLTSTDLTVSVGPGPSDFNAAKGEYAVGVRLSLSPT